MLTSMRAPFGSHFARLYALVAIASAIVAIYRAGLYLLPVGAWAVAFSLLLLGLVAPLGLGPSIRSPLLTGKLPLALAVPFVGFVLTPRLVPSPLTVGPFLFCAGALTGACAIASVNARHRRRRLRRLHDHGDAASFVQMYFDAGTATEAKVDWRAVRRALRAQAWIPTPARRAHAAATLRRAVAAIQMHTRVQIPAELPALTELAQACAATPEHIRSAWLSAAEKLETGGRIVRWRHWLWSLVGPGLDAERDWIAAVDLLARRHRIATPNWFRSYRRALARSPLTPRDVAPTRAPLPGLARPLAAGIAVLVFASVLLSTATAQTPVNDARRLPVKTGPRPESHVEPRLSAVLSNLAGHRSEVRCWSRADWQRLSKQRRAWPRHDRRLGRWSAYASPAHDEAQFSPTLCAVLSRVAYGHIPAWSDEWPNALAFSVATLAHEAQHLRGIFNEAKAECYGMQSISRTAQLLGRSWAEGRYLAQLYWRDEYPDIRDSAYRSDECRDGGKLDLYPDTNVWP
jgi:hypothetical protein